MIILKFGGTSMGSVAAIEKSIAAISQVYKADKQILVVCSAMSGVTNLLQKMAQEAAQGLDFVNDLKKIETQHLEVIQSLLDPANKNEIIISLKILFNEIDVLLEGIQAVQEISSKNTDRILSYGERCSSLLVTALIKQKLNPAVFTDARNLIVTDSHFGLAKVQEKKTRSQILKWYKTVQKEQLIPVVTGFIAANEKGTTTTLGRGGSDYTAALFGAILDANQIQIWTDVDGFMTADPRLVPYAVSLPELSYAEATELSYFGAKVIYPPTMIPAIEKQIPLVIKNTFNPSYAGTYIHHISSDHSALARGIASINDVCLVNIEGNGLVGFKGFSGRLFSVLARNEVNVIMITQASSEHSISIAIETKDLENAQEAIKNEFENEIKTHKIAKISVESEVSILSVVGENMRQRHGLAGIIFHAMGRVSVNIIAIAQGSSELNISMVVQKKCLSKAINAIHNDLFLSKTKNTHLIIAGIGNIGKTLIKQIDLQQYKLKESQNIELKLLGISNSTKFIIDPNRLRFENWEKTFLEAPLGTLEAFIAQILETSLPNMIFVDNTASPEISKYYHKLLEHNISIVTCNKIATSDLQAHYDKLKQTALEKEVKFYYETNVGAGLPIIKTLQDLVHSGDSILKIEAILSGTISYIFNNYLGETTFAAVVKEAQEKGYTEPNPVDDLSGKDFARKMLIIARETGIKLEIEDIELVPILPPACLEAKDVTAFYQSLEHHETYFATMKENASKNQAVLRYIGKLEAGKVTIQIEAVDASHPFYNLTGSDNIISFTTQRYLHNPLVVKGPGAGAEVTAAGVFADIMRASVSM